MNIVLNYLIPLIIIIISIDKNPILFGFIVACYCCVINEYIAVISENILSFLVLFAIEFIPATIAFKVANKLEDSKFIYVFAWSVVYTILRLIISIPFA